MTGNGVTDKKDKDEEKRKDDVVILEMPKEKYQRLMALLDDLEKHLSGSS